MSAESEHAKLLLAEDAAEGERAEKDATAQKRSELQMLQIQEEDLATQKAIREERLATMQWLRRARNIVAALAIGIPIAMLAWLFVALTVPCVGKIFYDDRVDMWLKVVVVSGTFLSFIFVFGGVVKGIFSSSRNEDHKESRFDDLETLAAAAFRGMQ